MKRVLLTGASGFIARHAISSLADRGFEVHVASRAPAENATTGSWHRADLLNLEQTARLMAEVRPTHLLHFAWCSSAGNYWVSPENLRWVQAGLELLQAFALYRGERVVMAGTCAEYDWNYGYCSEGSTPLRPASLYGVCKHALQLMLDAFSRQTDISAAWGRIFFLYGPGEHPNRLVSSVIRSLLLGEPARCSHGNQLRDYLHVQDVADAFVALLESDFSGPVNVASGNPVAVKEIIGMIAEKLDRPDLVQLGALPSPLSDPRVLIADTARLAGQVAWLPKYDLERGLEQTISWWKNQLAGEAPLGAHR